MGLNAVHLAFDVLNLPKAIGGLQEIGTIGCNVTIPHKEETCRPMDWLSEEVRKSRAMNMVKFEDRLLGYNTDVSGVPYSLELLGLGQIDFVLLLEAGGAARSVLLGVRGRARKVFVTSRNIERARKILELCDKLGLDAEAVPWTGRNSYLEKIDFLIDATPVGTEGKGIPINPALLRKGCYVFDLVYNPPRTPLIEKALKKECKAIGGLPMFIRQAAEAEKIWFGVELEDVMIRATPSYLGVKYEV